MENNKSTDIKLFNAQISKIIHSGGTLGSLLSKLAGPLIKVAVLLAKIFLAQLGIVDAGIQKKIPGSGTATLIMKKWTI